MSDYRFLEHCRKLIRRVGHRAVRIEIEFTRTRTRVRLDGFAPAGTSSIAIADRSAGKAAWLAAQAVSEIVKVGGK